MRLTWTLLGGIGLGAGLMYFPDPQRGARRRVRVRHITCVIHATPVRLNSIALDRSAHAGGWAAHTGTRLRPAAKRAPTTDTDGAIGQCHLTPRPSLAGIWQEVRARLSRVYGAPADAQHPRKVSLWVKIPYTV